MQSESTLCDRICRTAALPLLLAGLASPAAAQDLPLTIWPGPDLQERLQTALIEVEPGGTVRLGAGVFRLTDGLSLNVDGVTVAGSGKERTRLEFSEQETSGQGLLVQADNVTLRDFAVLNTRSDGVKAQNCKNIRIQRLHVEWTRGPHPENGAYGIYPVQCQGVLIEDSTAIAASDAGLYVGQSQNIIVRNNVATHNVAGLEIENSYYADVHGNRLEHNTGGILIFDLPNLPQQGGHSIRVFNNRSEKNDTPNFGAPGTTVADLPVGVGMMVMANREVEIFGNHLGGNSTANLLIVSYQPEYDDPDYDPYPRNVHIHGNRFENGGFAPDEERAWPIPEVVSLPVPDIVWDGVTPVAERLFGGGDPAVVLGEGNERADGGPATFVNLDLIPWAIPVWRWFHSPDYDTAPYVGGRESLAEVELEF